MHSSLIHEKNLDPKYIYFGFDVHLLNPLNASVALI